MTVMAGEPFVFEHGEHRLQGLISIGPRFLRRDAKSFGDIACGTAAETKLSASLTEDIQRSHSLRDMKGMMARLHNDTETETYT